MSNTGDDGGSIWWTLVKILALIVIGVVILRLFFRMLAVLVPVVVLALIAYGVYWLLTRDKKETATLETTEPLLLETDEDPLERRFKELEAEEARVDAEIEKWEREERS